MNDETFCGSVADLVRPGHIVIDRPRGSHHPRYPDVIYPLDYGYVAGTSSGDNEGIDVWVGSIGGMVVSGVIVTIDAVKRDAEIKLLIACTSEEMDQVLSTHLRGSQAAIVIRRTV